MNMDIDDRLMNEFKDCVGFAVAQHYKKDGVIARQRLLWKLTKHWNSRPMHAGIPGEVRRKLGEQEATRLFQETANEIIYNPEKLQEAVRERERFVESFNSQVLGEDKPEISKYKYEASEILAPFTHKSGVNTRVLSLLVETLLSAGYECRAWKDYEHTVGIGVKGIGNIYANDTPIIIQSIIGGFDPNKTMSDEFEDKLAVLNNRFNYIECNAEHIPKDDGKDFDEQSDMPSPQELDMLTNFMNTKSFSSMYAETIITIETVVTKFTEDDTERLIKLLSLRTQEIEVLNKSLAGYGLAPDDEGLYLRACEEVIRAGKASTALLQRRLQISYAKADELMNEMSKRNIIKRHTDKPSEVLVNDISECQW